MRLIRYLFTAVMLSSLVFIMTPEIKAQNYLLLLKKKGSPKNHKFRLGSDISLRASTKDKKITGTIHQITDTTILVDFMTEVNFEDISYVYRDRYFFKLFSTVLFIAGGGYFLLDGFNRAINQQYPIITQNTLVVTGSLVGVGFAFKFMDTRKYRIGKNWELQILDLSY